MKITKAAVNINEKYDNSTTLSFEYNDEHAPKVLKV